MTKFTCAVIGLGNIGLLYDMAHKDDYVLTHTKAYIEHPDCRLLFGVDIDQGRRKIFERYTGLPAFKTIKDASNVFTDVDIVSICVHVEDRIKIVSEVFTLNPKLIFLEKPIARNCDDAKKIIRMCKRKKIPMCINYHRRFEKSISNLRQIIRRRKFGRLLHVTVAYNRGFFNNGSHYIDMLLFLMGRPISFQLIRKVKTSRDYDIDAILSYPSADVYFKTIKSDVPTCEMQFWFERGKIEYKKFGNEIIYHNIKKDKIYRRDEELALHKVVQSGLPYVMRYAVDNVCGFLRGKEKLLSTEVNALDALTLCELIANSN